MNVLKMGGAVALAMGLVFFQACASDENAEEYARRKKVLEDEKESLQNQLNDKAAVENTLNRQVETQRQEIASLRAQNEAMQVKTPLVKPDAGKKDKDEKTASELGKTAAADIDVSGLAGNDVDVIRNKNGSVTLRLSGDVFAPGQDGLTKAGEQRLRHAAAVLKKNPGCRVSIEAHTDATPLQKSKEKWGTNLALSMARALSVNEFLKREEKIAANRMSCEGYGDSKPLVAGTSKAANDKNRRVELVLTKGD